MGRCFVSFIVNLSAESVSELLGAAAALLTQIMALSEVLTEKLVVTVNDTHLSVLQNTENCADNPCGPEVIFYL